MDSRNKVIYDIQVNGVNDLDGLVSKSKALSLEFKYGAATISDFANTLEYATKIAGSTLDALRNMASLPQEALKSQASVARDIMQSLATDASRISLQSIQERLQAETAAATVRQRIEQESSDKSLQIYRSASEQRIALMRRESEEFNSMIQQMQAGSASQQTSDGNAVVLYSGNAGAGVNTSARIRASSGSASQASLIEESYTSRAAIAAAPQIQAQTARALLGSGNILQMQQAPGGGYNYTPGGGAGGNGGGGTGGYTYYQTNGPGGGGGGFGGGYPGAGGAGGFGGGGFPPGGGAPPAGGGVPPGGGNAFNNFFAGNTGGFLRGALGLGFFGSKEFVSGEAVHRVVEGLAEVGMEAMKTAQETQNMALRLGISDTAMEKLSAEAKISGVNLGSITIAAKQLGEALEEPATKGKAAATVLRSLGVELRDAKTGATRDRGEVFMDSMTALSKADPGTQTIDAFKLFGRSGKEMLPLIQNLEHVQDIIKEIGVGSDENLVSTLVKGRQETEKLSVAWDLFMAKLTAEIIPIAVPILINVAGFFLNGAPTGPKDNTLMGAKVSGPAAWMNLIGGLVGQGLGIGPAAAPTALGKPGDNVNSKVAAANAAENERLKTAYHDKQENSKDGLTKEISGLKKNLDVQEEIIANYPDTADPTLLKQAKADADRLQTQIAALEAKRKGLSAHASGAPDHYAEFLNQKLNPDQRATEFTDYVATYNRSSEKDAQRLQDLYSEKTKHKNAAIPPADLDRFNAAAIAGREVEEDKQDRLEKEATDRKEDLLSHYRQLGESKNQDPILAFVKQQNEQFKREMDEYEKLYERTHGGQHAPQSDIDKLRGGHDAAVQMATDDMHQERVTAADNRISTIGSRETIEATRRRISMQQRLATINNDGRESYGTISGAASDSAYLANQAYGQQMAEIERRDYTKDPEQKRVDQAEALAQKMREINDANLQAEMRIAELRQQASNEAKQQAGSFYDALRSGNSGDFFKKQFDQVGKNIFSNAMGPMFQQMGGIANKIAPHGGVFKDMFKGTFLDDPVHATQDNTKAIVDLTNTLNGTGGGAASITGIGSGGALGGARGLFGPAFSMLGGKGLMSRGGGLTSEDQANLGDFDNSELGQLDNSAAAPDDSGEGSGDGGSSAGGGKLGGQIAMSAGGVMQAVQGFKQGGAKGDMQGIAGTAMAIAPFTGPAAPFVMAGAAVLDLVSSFIGNGKQEREKQLQDDIDIKNKYTAPAGRDYYFSMQGGGSDLGAGGVSRQGGSTVYQTVNVNAMDTASFSDYLKRNTNAFAGAMAHAVTNSGNQTLSQALSKSVSTTRR